MTINRSQVIDDPNTSQHEVFDVTPVAALPRKGLFSRGLKRTRKVEKTEENTTVRKTS